MSSQHSKEDESKHSGEEEDQSNQGQSKDEIPEEELGQLDKRGKGFVAIIMFALSLAVFLSALDTTIVTVALPAISEHFHSASAYTWIGSAYLLSNAASTPLWGKLSDIFGRKPMLLLANFLFLIGSLVCALSINVGMLITARAIQGAGGGGLLTLVDIAISDLFSLRTRGAYLGAIGAVWALACALGPIIGGAFTSNVSWRWCFYINLPLDGISLAIIFFLLDLKTPRTPIIEGLLAIDWLGTLLSVGGTVMFLIGMQDGGTVFPWDSVKVICLIVFGVFTFALFFVVQWKFAKYPIMPLRIFKHRSNIGVLLVCFFHGFAFIADFYYMPLYFQAVKSASALDAGVYVLPSVLATGIAAAITGAFIGATGQYLPPIIFGFGMLTLGYGLFIDLDANSGWAKLIIYQLIVGVGIGPNFQAPLVALQTHIKQNDVGSGTATFNFVRNISTAVSVIIGQVVFQNQMQKKESSLSSVLSPANAKQLSGAEAGANTDVINSLPSRQKSAVQSAYADSLMYMWIMYTVFAAVGMMCIPLIRRKVLTSEHQETEVGLEAEKKKEEEEKEERRVKDAERGR